MNAEEKLLDIYRQFPCRTLPNAFWKTASVLEQGNLVIQKDSAHKPKYIAVWQEGKLLALWCRDLESACLSKKQIDQVPFVLVHADGLPLFSHRKFLTRKAYFRLIHRHAPLDVPLPPEFCFKPVDPEGDFAQVVRLLRDCYQGIDISIKIVRSWTSHPVYDPSLWVWVVEQQTGKNVGLGIAELDPRAPEASLEWIQIMPHFQNRGLGTALVSEILRRVARRAAFTTVSGDCGSPYQPERLYRKCGFSGSDVWWLLAI